MSLWFLPALAIGLGTLYVYLRWSDEGAPIFGFAAIVGLVTALVLAPWQVQAGLLVLGTLLASYLLQQRQVQQAAQEGAAVATAVADRPATTVATSATLFPADQGTTTEVRVGPAAPRPKKILYRGIEVEASPPGAEGSSPRAVEPAAEPEARPSKASRLQYRGRPVQ